DRERKPDRRDVRQARPHHQGRGLNALSANDGLGYSMAEPTLMLESPRRSRSTKGGCTAASTATLRNPGGTALRSPSVHTTTAPFDLRSARSIHGARSGLPSISTRGWSGA